MSKRSLLFHVLLLSLVSLSSTAAPRRLSPLLLSTLRQRPTLPPLTESFESGSKSTYAPANIDLSSGSWYFNNALIGSLPADQKTGAHSARIRNAGSIRMNFDYPDGASTITLQYAVYGTDKAGTWELQVSTDGGSSYTRIGNSITSTTHTLRTATIPVNITGRVRIAIVKTDGAGRLNIDDITIHPYNNGDNSTGGSATGITVADDDNMLLGNPSQATADTDNYDNYLMVKTYYTLSYSRDRGTPNWVSWHVQASDLDTLGRSNNFRADSTLPVSWYHVSNTSYSGSGFDRGHNCPSADRTASTEANSETFLMTNMMPQAPKNNEQTWASLESYERTLVKQGNEVYIVAGSYGTGGTGKSGTKTSLDNGHVNVPSNTWKVIVVLPDGTGDLSRINTSTRVISVIMPNINTLDTDWKKYRTSMKAIEAATGYDLLSNVPAGIRQILEPKVDDQ